MPNTLKAILITREVHPDVLDVIEEWARQDSRSGVNAAVHALRRTPEFQATAALLKRNGKESTEA